MSRCAWHQSCRGLSTKGSSSSRAFATRQGSVFRLPPRDGRQDEGMDSEPDFPTLFDTLTSLKTERRKPSRNAYGDLLRLAAQLHRDRSQSIIQGVEPAVNLPNDSLAWELANAAIKDAGQGDVELNAKDYGHILQFAQIHPATLPFLLRQIPPSVKGSADTLMRLCHVAIQKSNVDGLLPILDEMFNRQISLSSLILGHAVRLCCDLGLSRIALDLVDKYESSSTIGLEAPLAVWTRILRSSAETYFFAGVERSWSKTVASRRLDPDEGLLLNIMNVAARSGKPEMVSDVLEAFSRKSLDPQEYHLVALLEAYVKAGQVPQALQVLSTIRSSGLTPTAVTAQPIVAVLETTELVDQAFWALEDFKLKGVRIDVTALNVVIEASAKLGDLQRVRATQMAASDLDVRLDVDSFNHVLFACASTGNRKLADTIMKEMSDAGIVADGMTYHHMLVCCLSQPNYEDAFFFLEKSKSEGHKPSAEAYQQLANKCESSRDSRVRLVVEEAESLGYKIRSMRRRDERGGSEQRKSART